jgi:hypothetical protein
MLYWLMGYRRRNETPADPAARLTAQATVWLAAFTICLVLTSIGTLVILRNQLREMHEGGIDTHNLATAAGEQAKAMQIFSDRMKAQADQTQILANQAKAQAAAAQKAADAAEKTAETAKETLHSERADLRIEQPNLDFSTKSMRLPLFNTGHISSGELVATIHEATFETTGPFDTINMAKPSQKDWQHMHWDSVATGNFDAVIVPIPPLDENKFNTGKQLVLVAGSLSYGDGLDKRPRVWHFCFRNSYHLVFQKVILSTCNAETVIPILEKADGYPNNEHQH